MSASARRLALYVGFSLVVFVVGLGGGILIDRTVVDREGQLSGSAPNFSLVRSAWRIINRVYVDRSALKSSALTYGAISGMVDALGDTGHSTFLSPDMVQDERSFTKGEYVGVGLEIQLQNDQVTIVAPMDGSPAFKAGLRPGEIIQKVDSVDVLGFPLQDVVKRIMGPVGTKVVLTIFNPSDRRTKEVTLKRARIRIRNVTWRAIPGTRFADLRVAAFSQNVTSDLRASLADIERKGLAGVVLDLRNDPGGILDEAIGVASQFLPSGNVLLEKNAKGQSSPVPVRSGGIAPKMPLVVMIDGGTASAAEIVAGALQDAKRATLVGEKTFGTGTVLGLFPLDDGSQLLLATEEWLTPKGRVIWHKGINPDVAVTLPPDAVPIEPDSLATMTSEELASSDDTQLTEAVEVLDKQIGGASP